jgi:RNA polymerase sigma-70 factor (ECF subfamily)
MPELAGLHDLMERYVDGDPLAFSRLHARLVPRLRGFLLKLVRDEAAVDDLVQLTLLKAHLARDRFAVPGGDPDGAVQAWYLAIGRNAAMDLLRERHRGQRRAATDGPSQGDAVDELPGPTLDPEQLGQRVEHEAEIAARVREAIARLPPGQRDVVELHKLHGMSMAEIAARLAVREGAVRVRAHRAYKALARLLAPGELGPLLAWLGLGGWPGA